MAGYSQLPPACSLAPSLPMTILKNQRLLTFQHLPCDINDPQRSIFFCFSCWTYQRWDGRPSRKQSLPAAPPLFPRFAVCAVVPALFNMGTATVAPDVDFDIWDLPVQFAMEQYFIVVSFGFAEIF